MNEKELPLISDRELNALLADADPLRGRAERLPDLPPFPDLLSVAGRRRWPVRSRWTALLSSLVIIGAGTGAAAVAGVFSPDQHAVVTAPDFRAGVLPELTPTLPLPAGKTWAQIDDFYAARWQRAFGPGETAEYDRGAVTRDLENLAACEWDRTWLAARARGDAAAASEPARQIRAAPSWSFIARYHDGVTDLRVVIAAEV